MTDMKLKASRADKATFMAAYGHIYEHSPWVAEGAWKNCDHSDLDTLEELSAAMAKVVDAADEAAKMKLICAHPDLAGKAALRDELTAESRSEQAGAGLDQCSADELDEFNQLNSAYKVKFGFPFIIAVKGLDRYDILAAFRSRLNHDRAQEFDTALDQIHKIARLRLADLT
ncbi:MULTISPECIES: 2-oxo-4-hydroxy-4-carboxy-5-ureidoimidazoline decarboxylase [Kordiimonas]|jgi:OHCU decarboxylase|uniref:2-oxo-4-hydroxy-4-carboxy-5-ureidoimidazoline decarboxylase n=1 Tax=Kordiimonas lacus TaxID=637679 RepID=A0A1G6U7F1_9PROT|nr:MULTISPECIES: 2-oxo-4-hydroxy-4-carboxy-5-ureidoimidazoline decarboxylase [Kordiimonas]SDD37310.1 OHCU decarboxylase [Kordiimonas lacus]